MDVGIPGNNHRIKEEGGKDEPMKETETEKPERCPRETGEQDVMRMRMRQFP